MQPNPQRLSNRNANYVGIKTAHEAFEHRFEWFNSDRSAGLKDPWGRMANILVVEDNDDVREMMAVTLELEGHQVSTAVNGRDALEKLHTGSTPSLILLDLMMPVMNGWEFRQALERDPELRQVPVVVVSAATSELAHRAQAAAYLPKPLDIDELLDVVGDFCGNGGPLSWPRA